MIAYLSRRPSLPADLLYAAPLLLLYQVGTLRTGDRNGVDFVTTLVLRLQATWPWARLALLTSGAAATLILYAALRHRERFRLSMGVVLLAESALYALLMGNLILAVMVHVLGLQPPVMGPSPAPVGLARVLVISAGAGVHEELVFRVLIYGGLLAILGRGFGVGRGAAIVVSLAVSAALFSGAHHLPPHGEPFTRFAFLYRLLAGVVFGLLYHTRGYATAAYTHFLYDVLVLWAWQ